MWNALNDHLKETGQSTDDFGKKIGTSGATVRRYIAKKRRPGPDEFKSIYEKSNHKVQPNSFYDLPSGVTASGSPDRGGDGRRSGDQSSVGGAGDTYCEDVLAGQLPLFAGASS